MRRKFAQPALPNLYFRDGCLSVPGYHFEPVRFYLTTALFRNLRRVWDILLITLLYQASPWQDTGSQTLLAEGRSLRDQTPVLAKIAPAAHNGSICLEREAHL